MDDLVSTQLPGYERCSTPSTGLLALPAEIRIAILEYALDENIESNGFASYGQPSDICFDTNYSAQDALRLSSTCRQFYHDIAIASFKRTNFVVSSQAFFTISPKLQLLQPRQVEAIRSMTFVADARHFRKLIEWREYAFGVSNLNLDTLYIVLHRSSFWHYLFDYTSDIVKLLRGLQNVRRIVFVRNGALVKGSFLTWYNRLVGLILKVDHHERYDRSPASPEKTWWRWEYDDVGKRIVLDACPAKVMVDEETYMQQIVPLMEELRISMEKEEWNPDPRARMMFY